MQHTRYSYLRFPSILLAFLLVGTALPSAAQPEASGPEHVGLAYLPDEPVRQELDELLSDWRTFDLPLAEIERQARTTGKLRLRLGGQLFRLELEPVDLRAPDFRAIWVGEGGREDEAPAPAGTYRGRLAGQPDSTVRILILPDLLQGYVKTDDDWYFLDPMVKFSPGAAGTEVVLFREKDVRPGGQSLCGSTSLQAAFESFDPTRGDPFGGATTHLVDTAFEAQIATEADFEYRQIFGSNTFNQISGILNQVDGIMKPELGIGLRITLMRAWLILNDPYSSTDPSTLLGEFQDEWNTDPPTTNRDLAHLFTGKNLNGNTIGIAFVGAVCDFPDFAYGLSQNHSLIVKLVAHEIGHNFSAQHDDQVSPPASTCNGSGTIMCSIIQSGGLARYSSRSKSDVTSFIDGNGCMDPVAPARPLSISIISERCNALHTVSWSATGGATSYQLFRSTSSSFSNSTQVFSGSGTSYFGTQAGYYYRVRACNNLGCSGFRATTSKSQHFPGCL